VRVAVVFGAAVWPGGVASPALARRTDHAAHLFHAGAVDAVLVSGGLGRHPPSEARVMAARLAAAGVPPSRIHLDETATTTMTTACATACWWRRRPTATRLVAVTDRYHAPRARLALWGFGIDAPVASPPAAPMAVPARLRAWRREAVGLPVYAIRALARRATG
jgi:vancomycin permeability regulator SanA